MRVLADFIPQIVWTSTPEGSLDYYKRQWFEYTGMTLEQQAHRQALRRRNHPSNVGDFLNNAAAVPAK